MNRRERVVLAYFGGTRVRTKDREVRCEEGEPGWLEFEIEGRVAKRVGPAEPSFAGLPKVRGVLALEWLFRSGEAPERVMLVPPDEPPMFASCTCHRWHDGTLVFGELDFEGEVEGTAREAFAERMPVDWVKGAPAAMRAAFAWAVVARAAREKKIPCSVREAWPRFAEIAEHGEDAARALLDELDELRHGKRVMVGGVNVRVRQLAEHAARAAENATLENATERAEAALHAAGAVAHGIRRIDAGRSLEVHFMFGGERFVTVCDALTLHVLDAGICLVDHAEGHRGDDDLTLDSLPSAIKEAMDRGVLVITRR